MENIYKIKNNFSGFIIKSWWVVLFLIFSYVFYYQSITKKDQEILALKCRYFQLEQDREEIFLEKMDLEQRIAAQNDPDFIEMLLKEELGKVPDGQLKVYFRKRDS